MLHELKEYKDAVSILKDSVKDQELRKTLAEAYEAYMIKHNLTVVDASIEFGISYGTYYKLLKGQSLSLEVLCRLIAQL